MTAASEQILASLPVVVEILADLHDITLYCAIQPCPLESERNRHEKVLARLWTERPMLAHCQKINLQKGGTLGFKIALIKTT